jgi:hypothetical protein
MVSHKKLLNRFASWLIIGLRPLLGPALCYYQVSCGSYALDCLKNESFFYAVFLIFKRLVSYNPVTARFRFLSRSSLIVACFLLSSMQMTLCVPTLITEDISVNQCNPESLRSKELLLQLVAVIRETCKLINGHQNPKISATVHGLSVMCEIEEPRTYIILAAENESNELHCSIITKQLTKKQKKLIEQTMVKLFCTKSS